MLGYLILDIKNLPPQMPLRPLTKLKRRSSLESARQKRWKRPSDPENDGSDLNKTLSNGEFELSLNSNFQTSLDESSPPGRSRASPNSGWRSNQGILKKNSFYRICDPELRILIISHFGF